MDIIDIANERSEELLAEALYQRQLRRPTERPTIYCIDCDEPIDSDRRAANPNACRCIDCQTIFEDEQRRARYEGYTA